MRRYRVEWVSHRDPDHPCSLLYDASRDLQGGTVAQDHICRFQATALLCCAADDAHRGVQWRRLADPTLLPAMAENACLQNVCIESWTCGVPDMACHGYQFSRTICAITPSTAPRDGLDSPTTVQISCEVRSYASAPKSVSKPSFGDDHENMTKA